MKAFIKEFFTNMLGGLLFLIAISIWLGMLILIDICIPGVILRIVLLFLYSIISAALVATILSRMK